MKAVSTVLCNNILNRGFKEKISISPMKLQKLMYFICMDYTRKNGTSPISEQFEVWQFGPVLPSIYAEFKAFGSKPIKEYAKDANGKAFMVNEERNPRLAETIDHIWRRYKNMTGIELSQITHQTRSGWYKAYADGRAYITESDMRYDTAE